MANSNRPWGLSPVKSLIAGDYDGRGNAYHILSTDSTSSYHIGDVVKLSGTGDANGIADITKFAAGDASGSSGINGGGPVGVIVAIGTSPKGPWIDANDLTKIYAPQVKTKEYYALVADDPFLVFDCQEIGTGTALDATAIGLNANLTITAAHTGFVSTSVINNATEATTIGLDVRLLGLRQLPGNAFGAYARWLVMLNSHAYKMTTGV